MEDPIISDAGDWLTANPSESIATASRIFKVSKSTLRMSITRLNHPRVGRGGQNKLLTATQTKALKNWITTQYKQGLGATKQMTFAAICYIRKPAEATTFI
jgi:transposase